MSSQHVSNLDETHDNNNSTETSTEDDISSNTLTEVSQDHFKTPIVIKHFGLTIAENIHLYLSSLYVRCINEIPPLLSSVILATTVATLSCIIDHFLGKGLMFMEDIQDYRHFVAVMLICLATLIVQLFHPTVRGSGIPEMKLFLGDAESSRMIDYLSLRAFFTKLIGLFLASLSGFPVGKEGPFVHVSCALSYSIKFRLLPKLQRIFMRPLGGLLYTKSKIFNFVHRKYRNKQLHYMRDADIYKTLSSACALGVACTFGAPIGGVMFSIEVTSSLFNIANYWQAFFTAAIGAVVFRIMMGQILHDAWYLRPFLISNLPTESYGRNHVNAYLLISGVCGVMSSIFIVIYVLFFKFCQHIQTCIGKAISCISDKPVLRPFFHERSSPRRASNALLFSLAVSSFLCGIELVFNRNNNIPLSQRKQLELFFDSTRLLNILDVKLPKYDNDTLPSNFDVDLLHNMSNYFLPMLAFILVKIFILCPILICLPIPTGIFFPLLTIGSCIGRLLGDISGVSSAGCAIVGAAAFSGAVTHSVSTAVIITEMTGEIQYLLPSACAAFLGKFVSHLICRLSIYEMIMRQRFMPYVPGPDEELYHKFKEVRAIDIVQDSNLDLENQCLFRDVTNITNASIQSDGSNYSTNDHLRVIAKRNMRRVSKRWFLLPVMRRTHGYLEMMGYVRSDAALSYLKSNFRRCMQFHCTHPWWLMSQEEIANKVNNGILRDSFMSVNCLAKTFKYKKEDWSYFLSSEVDWLELLEEGPCSVQAQVGLPDVDDFLYRHQLPQVFVLDGSRLLGVITREMFVEKVKKLHKLHGSGSYWSATNYNVSSRTVYSMLDNAREVEIFTESDGDPVRRDGVISRSGFATAPTGPGV